MSLPTRPFGLRSKTALRLSHIIATGRPRLEVPIAVTAPTLPFMAAASNHGAQAPFMAPGHDS